MRLTGKMYDVDGLDEAASDIEESVITSSRIALDWDEDNERFHAVLHSKDGGITYQGNFGSPEPEAKWVMEAIRFTATNGQVLLWLKWHQKDRAVGGANIVHLASRWE